MDLTALHPRFAAASTPDKAAVIEARTGRARSFADLEARANQLAHLCRSKGADIGSCIAFLMEDRLECFDITWAAQRAGLYYLPVYTSITPEDAVDMVDHADAVLLFTSPRYEALAHTIADGCPQVRDVFVIGDAFDALLNGFPDSPIADEARGLPTQYTGGTTGKPKGLRSPLGNEPITTPDGLAALSVERFGFHPDMVLSTTAPLYHVAPVKLSMLAHSMGATTVLMGDFEPEWALSCIEKHKVTHGHWVPHMFVELVKLPDEVKAKYNISSLKSVVHAAAPCPPDIKAQLMDWWGPIVHEIYAGTEAVGFCMISPEEWLKKPGSVGRAVIGTLKILDAEGREVPPCTVGQVYFADALPFAYYKDPERTAAAKTAQGLVTMDDLGFVDADGYLYLRDRKGFSITVGDETVYPRVVEDALIGNRDVQDIGVTGWPKNTSAQYLVAIVKPGRAAQQDLAGQLNERVMALPDYARPHIHIFVKDFPRDADGKLDRAQLADIARKHVD